MDFGFANVAAITVICYLVGEIFKNTAIDNKWIPVICGACGLVLGIVAFLIDMPDFPGGDVISAAAVGTASGLTATGINQIYKQLKSD